MHPATHARTNPDKAACIVASTGVVTSYSDLDRASNRAAQLFRQIGLARGDVIAMILDNEPAVFEIAWAAQRAGLYLTSISTKLTAADVAFIVADSGARALIVSDRYAALATSAIADLPGVRGFALNRVTDALASWRDACCACPDTPIADESAGADMLYSSGTTGRPKGVKPPLPDGPIDALTTHAMTSQALYGVGEDTRYLSTSPLYHAAPLRWGLSVHRLGGTVVIMERFDAEEALACIERYGITHATWVPTHFIRMLKLPDAVRRRYDFSSLRAVVHAAAPCPVHVKQAMIDWWGPIIFEYYAGTEACGMTALSSEEWLQKPGSVGRAVVGTVKILGSQGEVLPHGEVGDVYFADGPRFEYHNDPEKTASAHNGHGWATLGDVGRLDEDGYLFLTDRKSFMIISGGVNIYPQEIENRLVEHPMVADVAVIGLPDDEMGEKVVAVVQLQAGVSSGAQVEQELGEFARATLGSIKTPRQFIFRDDFPREPTGKLMKRKLIAEYR